MTIQEIKEMIEKRAEILSVPYSRDPGYEMCRKFILSSRVGKAADLMRIDAYECAKCLYYLKNKTHKTPQECSDFVDSFSDYMETIDFHKMCNLFDILSVFGNSSQKDNIVAYLLEKGELSAKLKFRNIDVDEIEGISAPNMAKGEKNSNLKKVIKGFRTLQKKFDVAWIINAIGEDNDTLNVVLGIIIAQKKMLEDKEKIDFSMSLFSLSKREKDRTRMFDSFLKDFYKSKEIMEDINSIGSFVSGIDNEEMKYYRDARKELNGYSTSMSLLEDALLHREITNARNIVKGIKNEEIKRSVLQLIHEHNMSYYDSLISKFDELNGNSTSAYIAILNNRGIQVDCDTVKRFMFNSKEDFEKIVSIVSLLELNDDVITKVLSKTNLAICIKIKEYMDKGILSVAFLRDNLDLFDGEALFETLNKNIALLDSYNINPLLFAKSPDALFVNPELFASNVALLNSYGLLKTIKLSSSLSFIGKHDLSLTLDKLIELGYERFLEEDLSILSSDNISRLEVLRAMHFELYSLDEVVEVLNTNRFMIRDDEIDSYIPNFVPLHEKVNLELSFEELEKYRKSKLTYEIGDTLISSNKVKRLLNEGFSMYDAIFTGVKIGEEEYSKTIHSLSIQK